MATLDEEYFRKIITAAISICLVVLTFLVLKPILISLVIALILAFIFSPVYDWLYKRIKHKDVSVVIILIFLLALIILPLWYFTPILIDQSFKFFQATNQIDFITPLKEYFPGFFASEQFSNEAASIIASFISRAANFLVNFFADILINLPTIMLHLTVIFFTFYFVLRDKEKVLKYISSFSPFTKDVEKKIANYSKGITASVLYGQVVVGAIQGIIAGIGFFAFGAPNALFLTLLAGVAGVFPVVGTALVWIPVVIYMMVAGDTFAAFGILVFGIFSSTIDNILRPMIVAKRTNLHSAVIIVGMIGGLFLFGIMGLILGPLILGYLIILLEIYKKKDVPGMLSNP